MTSTMNSLYYRWGDLFPDNFPSMKFPNQIEKERMLNVRKIVMDKTESLRKQFASMSGKYVIDKNMSDAVRIPDYAKPDFRKWLFEHNLIFNSRENAELVASEMKSHLNSINLTNENINIMANGHSVQ